MNLGPAYIEDAYRSYLTFPDPEGYANGTTFPDNVTFGQLSDGGGIVSPIAVSKVGLNARPGSAAAQAFVAANPTTSIMKVQRWTGAAYADIHSWDNAGLQTISGTMLFASGNRIDTSAAGALAFGDTNATTVNLGTAAANTNVNIGTAGTNIIQIGNANSTVNILGTVLYEDVTNLQVKDKLITLNKGGAAASGTGVGFEIEENALITGYIKTTGGRDGYLFKAPANAADSSFIFQSTSARTFTWPDTSGTVVLSTTISSFTTSSQWTTNGSDIYYNTGKVGIGVVSPLIPFHVMLSVNTGDIAYFASSLGHGLVLGHNFANNRAYMIADSPSRTIGFGTSSQTAIFIDAGSNRQRVGINTDSPTAQLHVDSLVAGAQTVDGVVSRFVNAGNTFDTTAGALFAYAGHFVSNPTRSAGANDLTNVGVYATASGGQQNYAGVFEGKVIVGTFSGAPTAGTLNVNGTILTTAPTGGNGTAHTFKVGSVQAGVFALDTSECLEIETNAGLKRVGLVT